MTNSPRIYHTILAGINQVNGIEQRGGRGHLAPQGGLPGADVEHLGGHPDRAHHQQLHGLGFFITTTSN